ncbi:PPR repeat [Musa troglodytarum]|uniref:PPR repeat n=1 Tax=Musa troglodytarum TaxID=320322 RepID=A0A9E7KW29_9LILI|nr:PPR repeat [Musa troglodytarum]
MRARLGYLRRFSSLPLPASAPLPHLLSLLSRCSTFGHIAQAHAFMIARGLPGDNLLLAKFLHACSSLGFRGHALLAFDRAERPDVYLLNTMIRCLCRTDSAEHAMALFNRIQGAGLRPDTYSFPSVLKAVAHLGMLELGREVHGQITRFGLDADIHVSTALVVMYSDCGEVTDARKLFDGFQLRDVVMWNAMTAGYVKVGDVDSARHVFEQMPKRNVVSWTTVIAGFADATRSDEAITMFRRMQLEDGIEPDEVALLAVLSACANLGALDLGEWIHRFIGKRGLCKTIPLMNALIDMYAKSGNIHKALEVFEDMKQRSVVTWTTVIAGLASHGLGCLREARDLVRHMPFEPNGAIWGALLAAARSHGDAELGELALRRLVEIEPHNSGNYILLSNIYAAHEMWDDVARLRKMMKEKGVMNVPGASSIEVDGAVHEFTSRDGSHPYFDRIYGLLHEMSGHLKMIGYVPKHHSDVLDFEEGLTAEENVIVLQSM